MKTRILSLWESIHTSLWFIPTLMVVVAIGLSQGAVWLDESLSPKAEGLGRVSYPAGPEAARLLLSTIVGSTITVVGVTFSITIAALALTSSQFGPRILRSAFRRSRENWATSADVCDCVLGGAACICHAERNEAQ